MEITSYAEKDLYLLLNSPNESLFLLDNLGSGTTESSLRKKLDETNSGEMEKAIRDMLQANKEYRKGMKSVKDYRKENGDIKKMDDASKAVGQSFGNFGEFIGTRYDFCDAEKRYIDLEEEKFHHPDDRILSKIINISSVPARVKNDFDKRFHREKLQKTKRAEKEVAKEKLSEVKFDKLGLDKYKNYEEYIRTWMD